MENDKVSKIFSSLLHTQKCTLCSETSASFFCVECGVMVCHFCITFHNTPTHLCHHFSKLDNILVKGLKELQRNRSPLPQKKAESSRLSVSNLIDDELLESFNQNESRQPELPDLPDLRFKKQPLKPVSQKVPLKMNPSEQILEIKTDGVFQSSLINELSELQKCNLALIKENEDLRVKEEISNTKLSERKNEISELLKQKDSLIVKFKKANDELERLQGGKNSFERSEHFASDQIIKMAERFGTL